MRSLPCVFSAVTLSLLLSGCGVSSLSPAASPTTAHVALKGSLHGGQQPVAGASIQLYAANTTTDKGASTPMLITPVTTDSGGNFSITGDYTCPASNPLVYIVATGGNPGLPGTVNNTDIAMMSLLGTCTDLKMNVAFIFIDELTTVVSVQAAAPFMADYSHIGAAPTNPAALAAAFATASSMIDFSTGQFSGGSANLNLPEVTLNTLSDVIAACINTAGGSAGDGTPCGKLLSLAAGPDTISATLRMVQAPGQNTAALYNLITPSTPFQPYFNSVPSDFTATVGYTVPVSMVTGALDSNGNIWIYAATYSYDTTTDQSTDKPGLITVYDNNFNQLFTISPGTGGLYYPDTMVADAHGHVFAVNSNNTISEFSSTGAAISPPTGWSTGVTSTFTGSGPGNNYIYNPNSFGAVHVDALGNIWGSLAGVYPATGCYFEMNSSGVLITPAGNYCTSNPNNAFLEFTTDGAGDAWATSNSTISKVDASGNTAATAPSSQGCFFTFAAAAALPPPVAPNYETTTAGVLYDHVHNQVWGYSQTGAGAITNAGTAQFCDFGPTTLPVMLRSTSASTTPGDPYSSGSRILTSATLDGAGNLWFTTGGVSISGVVGSTPGTFTGNVTYSSFLSEINSSGTLVTPYNASTQSYGMQPTGLGSNVTGTAIDGSVFPVDASAALLGVDKNGNIWAFDLQTSRILKIVGLAKPNTVNY